MREDSYFPELLTHLPRCHPLYPPGVTDFEYRFVLGAIENSAQPPIRIRKADR